MNADKKISRTAKKSQTAILLAGEKLVLSGNINLITAENLSKHSGYSVGNIYHHFKNLDQVFINIFLKKRLEIFLELADEINKFPKNKSCEELCEILVNKSFEKVTKLKIKMLQYLYKIVLTKSEEPEKINLIIDVLIDPLIECRKRNKTNSFRKIEEDEMYGTFNMGVGLVFVANLSNVEDIISDVAAAGLNGFVLGEIVSNNNKIELL